MRVTRAQAAAQAASQTSLLDVIPVVASCTANLQEVALLGVCSKTCREAVQQSVLQNRDRLLARHVQDASGFAPYDEIKRLHWTQGLQWLLKATDGFSIGRAGHVLALHRVKQHAIQALLWNGFRFTYEQLVAAARQRTAGVECWVQQMVACSLRLPADMPKVAVSVCCYGCDGYKVSRCCNRNSSI